MSFSISIRILWVTFNQRLRGEAMRQLAFEFVKELEYFIRFATEVERELLKQMAKAIWRVSQTEGGIIDERPTDRQQDNGKSSQS